MADITFYCIRIGETTKVYMLNDVVQYELRNTFYLHYDACHIEEIKPNNVSAIEEMLFAKSTSTPTIMFFDEASFENFKREATTLIESNTQNVEIPDWAKKSLAKGNDVQFMHGRWVIVLH